ncbi:MULTISPECIES: FkbM family methyltransferase [unclassified Acidiplasma]|uniref:FkbM family methyltransferase n=1 Tax=unclassified Acidiplasma TaxID=2641301 RepID=UPI0009E1E492|nr:MULTISPECIES: FkbM family methyltransferase [unclassified Acidiplasma]WMT55535.1 MAG: FkbM family methyltransferase [Acidiplasma sp.]
MKENDVFMLKCCITSSAIYTCRESAYIQRFLYILSIGIMLIFKTYKRYKSAYKNYISVMWNLYEGKDTIEIILKNGHKEVLSSESVFTLALLIENNVDVNEIQLSEFKKFTFHSNLVELVRSGLEYQKAMEFFLNDKIPYKNHIFVMHGLKKVGDIGGCFVREEYKFLNVKDKVVVDIGSNMGDSSIYFALNGAEKVIALEPVPYSFNLAVDNIKENNLEGKVELLNAGYGSDGDIVVDENYSGQNLISSEKGKKVKIYSLKV